MFQLALILAFIGVGAYALSSSVGGLFGGSKPASSTAPGGQATPSTGTPAPGNNDGSLLNLPKQTWTIMVIIGGIVLIWWLKKRGVL